MILENTSYGNFCDLINGEIKVIKLSDKKIRLDYTVDLLSPDTVNPYLATKSEPEVLTRIELKVRYKLDPELGVYKILYPKNAFLAKLSNEFRVKMKTIHWYALIPNPCFIGDYRISSLIQFIYMTDHKCYKTWKRENILKSILSNEKTNHII